MIGAAFLAALLLGIGSTVPAAALPASGGAGAAPPAAVTPGAGPAPVPEEAAVIRAATDTVMGQIEAFRRNDFDAAYSYASAEIHQIFDRASFERMVRGGYPEIASPRSAVVSNSEVTPAGAVYLFLTIRGANGRTVDALYELVREGDRWRVNGVTSRPAAQTI